MNDYTIKNELSEYLQEFVSDQDYRCDVADLSELHHEAFNESYYIIGYYRAEQWLKKHDVSAFEGIKFVQDYEREQFGDEGVRTYDNAETLVNMIVYIIGEQLVYETNFISQLTFNN